MAKWQKRLFQNIIYLAGFALKWENDTVLHSHDAYSIMADRLLKEKVKRPLIVTDDDIYDAGLTESLEKVLKDRQIEYRIYTDVVANPPVDQVNKASQFYKDNHCDGLIGIGGGSALDTLKAIGVEVTHPNHTIQDLRGLLKLRHKPPFMVAIPTTAGTGSEATLATVVSEPENHDKYALMDHRLFPDIALLDHKLTMGLPKNLTAHTGMDALTHAVEAFTNIKTTGKTDLWAKQTVQRVDRYLMRAYDNPDDAVAREGMLIASFDGGRAFTRAYVGNVHAISHALTAFYGIPHGYANAVVLPHVLEYFGKPVHEDLAKLSDAIGLNRFEDISDQLKARRFIQYIKDLNTYFNINKHIPEIQKSDIETIAQQAEKEANPLYPVPVIFSQKDFEIVIRRVKGS